MMNLSRQDEFPLRNDCYDGQSQQRAGSFARLTALFMVLATTGSAIATAYCRRAELEAQDAAFEARKAELKCRTRLTTGPFRPPLAHSRTEIFFRADSLLALVESKHELIDSRTTMSVINVNRSYRAYGCDMKNQFVRPQLRPMASILACYVGKDKLLIWDLTQKVTAANAHRLSIEPATSGIFIDHFIAFSPGGNLLHVARAVESTCGTLRMAVEVALSNGPTVLESDPTKPPKAWKSQALVWCLG